MPGCTCRCKPEVGDVGVGTFKKLMSALVD